MQQENLKKDLKAAFKDILKKDFLFKGGAALGLALSIATGNYEFLPLFLSLGAIGQIKEMFQKRRYETKKMKHEEEQRAVQEIEKEFEELEVKKQKRIRGGVRVKA